MGEQVTNVARRFCSAGVVRAYLLVLDGSNIIGLLEARTRTVGAGGSTGMTEEHPPRQQHTRTTTVLLLYLYSVRVCSTVLTLCAEEGIAQYIPLIRIPPVDTIDSADSSTNPKR